jgi:hypothetical protein
LVLIVLCCVKCWSKTNNGKCLLIICFNLISDSYGGATWQPSAWEPWQQSQPGPGCSLRLYTLSLLHTSDPCFSSSYFFCLARCGFRLFPSFRWDTLWGVYSVVILPYLEYPLTVVASSCVCLCVCVCMCHTVWHTHTQKALPACDLCEADDDVHIEHAIFHCTHPHTVSFRRRYEPLLSEAKSTGYFYIFATEQQNSFFPSWTDCCLWAG